MESILYSQASIEERRPGKVSVRGWLAMATGLNLAFVVCMLICKPPWPHALAWSERFQTAAIYIVLACLAGAFGHWVAMPRRASGELGVLLRGALRGWVFLPAIALLIHRQSLLAQAIASVAAVLMAAYMFPFTKEGATAIDVEGYLGSEIFATEVQIGASSWVPFGIAVLWGATVAMAAADRMMVATLCLATAVYLLALQVASALKRVQPSANTRGREDRIYILITAAFLCVLFGLSNPAVLQSSLFTGQWGLTARKMPTIKAKGDASSGFHTIVLWPLEKEKKTVLRLPVKSDVPAPGAAEPLVIPFYGPYWYFKFEGETPGKDSQATKGDPLKVNVHSTDRLPLLMEAHQRLAGPIEMASCGEMQVVITNDVAQGALGVGLTLTDSSSKKKVGLNLGIKRAQNHETGRTEETITFLIPKRSALQRFDEITVTFVPDPRYATSGRKVAVEKFVVVPR
ncbi:hypothetical protein HDF16_004249 [Granulicella aggregans]|uniref:Uncharacterized protein n=1 Tax=Granulicella aggregans TaxID=474949 RepID=A0A7W8E4Y0_9BACT|nr:hypothetical protein [Granulicella aggregans]MBB5059523.1 hypothetical protein [Granulicella aggregans]